MFNVGPLELIVVLVIALLVLGPQRLPDVARSVGRGMREFRSALDRPDDDDEPVRVPPDEEEPTAALPEDGADEPTAALPADADESDAYQKDADSSEPSSSSRDLV